MNKETKVKIIGALERYMQEHNLSQNDIEKHTGVNASYLIEMRKGSLSITRKSKTGVQEIPIADKYYEKIADFVGVEVRKTYWKIQPTEQLIEAMAILEDAKQYGYTNVLIGETGCGKTTALELFASKNPTDVFIVTVSNLDAIGDLLEKLIDVLKIPAPKSKSLKLRAVSNKLLNMRMNGFYPVVIFDEAEYMKLPALCAMKELYDSLNRKCAIVLSAHTQFLDSLEKLKKRQKPGMPQFYRRIKFGIRVLPLIDNNYDLFLEDIEDKNLKKFLRVECENYGELNEALVTARREADRTGEELTENFVRKALNYPVNRI